MNRNDVQSGFEAIENEGASSWMLAVCSSPIIWGTALTFVFHALLPAWPLPREILERYFSARWMLSVEIWLFAIGVVIVCGKVWSLVQEFRAFEFQPALHLRRANSSQWDALVEQLLRGIAHLPVSIRRTAVIQRYFKVGECVASRGSCSGLEAHCESLHSQALLQMREGLLLAKTLIWSLPIAGITGTIYALMGTLSRIPADPLEQASTSVAASLATAGDPLVAGLALSLVLLFGVSFVEAFEMRQLRQIAIAVQQEILPSFSHPAVIGSPLLQAEHHSAGQLIEQTEKLICWQTDLWQQSLDKLRARWEQVVEHQQAEFTRQLQAGMESTLREHHSGLSETRLQLSAEFSRLSEELSAMVSAAQDRSTEQSLVASQAITGLWHGVQQELQRVRNDQAGQIERLTNALCDEVLACRSDLKAATHASTGQLRELHAQGEILLKIVGEEADLARLQRTLADNLEAVRAVDTFEKSLHSLTSAVHMLTIKNRAA